MEPQLLLPPIHYWISWTSWSLWPSIQQNWNLNSCSTHRGWITCISWLQHFQRSQFSSRSLSDNHRRGLLRGRIGRRAVAVVLQLLVRHGHRGVVIQALRHQLQRQRVLHTTLLLHLGPLVLEPDLDLGLVQPQLVGQLLPTLLVQVVVRVELLLQPAQLVAAERGPRPLLLWLLLFALDTAGPRTYNRQTNRNQTAISWVLWSRRNSGLPE